MELSGSDIHFPCGDEVLGRGSFASVYLAATNGDVSYAKAGEALLASDARLCTTNCRALKLVALDTKGHKEKVERELKTMRALERADHDSINIVAFHSSKTYLKPRHDVLPRAISAFADISFICLELEYVNGGSLFEHYWSYGPLGETGLRHCARDLLAGLNHLHELKIMHGDLKPENVLLAKDFLGPMTEDNITFKLCDNGESELFETQEEPLQIKFPRGSHAYIAPEAWKGGNATISRASDIWSLFIILYKMSLHAEQQDVQWQKNHPLGYKMDEGLREVRAKTAFAWMDLTNVDFWFFFGPYCNNRNVEPSFDRLREKRRCSLASDALDSFIKFLECMAERDPAQRARANSEILLKHKFLSDKSNLPSTSRFTPPEEEGRPVVGKKRLRDSIRSTNDERGAEFKRKKRKQIK